MERDLAIALLQKGYRALPGLGARAAVVPVRLLGRRALVVRGPEQVRRFYDNDLITRRGAVPPPLAWLLFGRGAIHGLDGAEHLHRKRLFLDLLDDDAARDMAGRVRRRLTNRLRAEAGHAPRVFDLLVEAYGDAALEWAGLEPDHAVSHRLAAIVDGFGGAGRAYPKAWHARRQIDAWARALVREARAGRHGGTPLAQVAAWRDVKGRLLPVPVAAVELVNLLRPTVAVAYLGAFAVLALDEHPDWLTRLADPDADELRRAFAHEVRRTFPFVPALAGRTRQDSTWGGLRLGRGRRVILDVPGTNLDEASYPGAARFDPERFVDREIGPYDYVPQGGGHADAGHRCPGEPTTVAILDATLEVFARSSWHGLPERGHDPERIPSRERLTLLVGGAESESDPTHPASHTVTRLHR